MAWRRPPCLRRARGGGLEVASLPKEGEGGGLEMVFLSIGREGGTLETRFLAKERGLPCTCVYEAKRTTIG